MIRTYLPLNALRFFESSARHLSFTRAAIELGVTQAAVSHQVRALEQRLCATLFLRLPRGLALTDEGSALLPVLEESFDRIGLALEHFGATRKREVLTVGAVGTLAIGWLLPRLPHFREEHPFVDLRLSTNNNRVDLAAEGLDYAIRFGDGAWHGTEAVRLFEAPLSVLCCQDIARRLRTPSDVRLETLLRSYRQSEWADWFAVTKQSAPVIQGPIFDSSVLMVDAAAQGAGVALAPPLMFRRHIAAGWVVQPFDIGVAKGAYWLTALKSRPSTMAMEAFKSWLVEQARHP